MKEKEALIFDCDGTLADTMPAHYRAWQAVLRPLDLVFDEGRFYSLGGVPTRKIGQMLVAESGRDIDVDALVKAKEDAFVAQLPSIVPIVAVVDIARAARGVQPIAVASGGRRPLVEATLRQIGVRDWFEVVITAEDTTAHKPEPDVFLEAARRLGVTPAHCTVYEDTELGLEAGRRAGMHVVDVRLL
jgi:beta-phosphoglucomutase-like phosphatase (HAD superfamily)